MSRRGYSQRLADNIATRWLKTPGTGDSTFQVALRDYVDTLTGSELDCIRLDILTDMVRARLDNVAERDRLLAAARRPHGH